MFQITKDHINPHYIYQIQQLLNGKFSYKSIVHKIDPQEVLDELRDLLVHYSDEI